MKTSKAKLATKKVSNFFKGLKHSFLKHKVTIGLVGLLTIFVVGMTTLPYLQRDTVVLRGSAPEARVTLSEAILLNDAAIGQLNQRINQLEENAQKEASLMQSLKNAICDGQ